MPALLRRAALLVDDSRLDYLHVRRLLSAMKPAFERIEWIQQWDGAAAALEQGPFDLFLVDLQLGAASGLDVMRDLRAAGVLEPIIALTGQPSDEVDRACAAAGASDFIDKGRLDERGLDRAVRYAEREAAVHRELERLNAALERRATADSEQARLMRFTIEQSTDGIFISTVAPRLADHVIVYANAALCRLVDRRAGEMLGGDVAQLLAPTPRVDVERLEAQIADGDAPLRLVSLAAARAPVPVNLRAMALRAGDGGVSHFVWSCRGADEGHARPQLDARRARFEALGQLTAGVAHTVTDRLTSLLGHLERLDPGADEAAQRRALDAATRAAEDVASQARLVVSLAGRDDGEGVRVVEPARLMESMTVMLRHAVGRLVAVEHEAGDCVWPVEVDVNQVELAVIDIALNARDAMPEGGTLTIGCHNAPSHEDRDAALAAVLDPGSDYTAISFTDHGTGMTPAVLARAREPYFTTKADGRGTGMGLAHVDEILRLARGAMTIESTVGEGSRVALYFRRHR